MERQPTYRFLTPTDVDRFITIPRPLYVETRLIVGDEDEVAIIDCEPCILRDYMFTICIPFDQFFNLESMEWRYTTQGRICPEGGTTCCSDCEDPSGTTVLDAGAGPLPLVNSEALIAAISGAPCRVRHFQQCPLFYRMSFKVGQPFIYVDPLGGTEFHAQLWAVYLDTQTGSALEPYRVCFGCPTGCASSGPETFGSRVYYSADLNILSASGGASVLSPWPLTVDVSGQVWPVTIIVDTDASGNPAVHQWPFTEDPRRSLLLYYRVIPHAWHVASECPGLADMERLYVAYRSHNVVPIGSKAGGCCCCCDVSGGAPFRQSFHAVPGVFYELDKGECARLFHPVSVVPFTDLLAGASGLLPFDYEFAAENPPLLPEIPYLGVRVSQLMWLYLFDQPWNPVLGSAVTGPSGVFPLLQEEMGRLVRGLSEIIADHVQSNAETRQKMLWPLMAGETVDTLQPVGYVREVLQRVPPGHHVGILAHVSLIISMRSVDGTEVERVVLRQLPLLIRLYKPYNLTT